MPLVSGDSDSVGLVQQSPQPCDVRIAVVPVLERIDEVVFDERATDQAFRHRPRHLLEEELGVLLCIDHASQHRRHAADQSDDVTSRLLVEHPRLPGSSQAAVVVGTEGWDETLVGQQLEHEPRRRTDVLDRLTVLQVGPADGAIDLQHAADKVFAGNTHGRNIELTQPCILLVLDTTDHTAESITRPWAEQIPRQTQPDRIPTIEPCGIQSTCILQHPAKFIHAQCIDVLTALNERLIDDCGSTILRCGGTGSFVNGDQHESFGGFPPQMHGTVVPVGMKYNKHGWPTFSLP